MAESPWGGVVDSLLGLGTGLVLGRIAQWLGERFTAIRRPGHQILGEAMVDRRRARVAGRGGGPAGHAVGRTVADCAGPLAIGTAIRGRSLAGPLTLVWILIWARLAAWLQLG